MNGTNRHQQLQCVMGLFPLKTMSTLEEKKKWLGKYRIEALELARFSTEYKRMLEISEALSSDTLLSEEMKQQLNEGKLRLCRRTSSMLRHKQEVEEKIDALPNGNHALLLRYRYIDGCSWEEISEKMSYSCRSLHYMHKKALLGIAI